MGWDKEELLYEYNSESQTCKEINGWTRNKCLVGSLYQTCFLFFLCLLSLVPISRTNLCIRVFSIISSQMAIIHVRRAKIRREL